MQSNYDAVIFDFGGVIGTDGFRLWLEANVPDFERRKSTVRAISARADRGQLSPVGYMSELAKVLDKDAEQILNGFLSLVTINSDVVAIIRELKAHFKVGLLSNYVAAWLDNILAAAKLTSLFDAIVISSAHGVLKPEPAAFQRILEMLSVSAARAIFIDDVPAFVEGAKTVGLTGCLFEDGMTLRQDLERLGLFRFNDISFYSRTFQIE